MLVIISYLCTVSRKLFSLCLCIMKSLPSAITNHNHIFFCSDYSNLTDNSKLSSVSEYRGVDFLLVSISTLLNIEFLVYLHNQAGKQCNILNCRNYKRNLNITTVAILKPLIYPYLPSFSDHLKPEGELTFK